MSTNENPLVGASDMLGTLLLGSGVVAAGALAWRATQEQRPIAAPETTQAVPETTATYPQGPRPTAALETTAAWTFPVPNLGDRRAEVSNPFTKETHLGVDLMFPRRDARDLIAAFPAGSQTGSKRYFMPPGVPALAVSAGIVAFAAMTPLGNSVVIRHANGFTTYYTHLSSLAIRMLQPVFAGQPLGLIGASPKDPAHLAHLHFELWSGPTRTSAIDPTPYLAAWPRVTTSASPLPSASLRNRGMTSYRRVGERGEPYPAWVQNLRGQSGVYVIREFDGPIVYVGSSVGRLYETLTRHFQRWRRYKNFWRGQYAEGHDPGLTYERGSVEVAITTTTPDDAHEEERRQIRRLEPRDNLIGQPELEDAPF